MNWPEAIFSIACVAGIACVLIFGDRW